jgi:hypothetical protein
MMNLGDSENNMLVEVPLVMNGYAALTLTGVDPAVEIECEVTWAKLQAK